MASETVDIAALRVTASDHAARIDQLIRAISHTPRRDPACERLLDQLFELRHPSTRILVCVLCEQPLPPMSKPVEVNSPQLDPEPDDERYDITQAGRDALRYTEAHEKLFGPWPRLSEVPADDRPRAGRLPTYTFFTP